MDVDDLDGLVAQIVERGLDPAERETYASGVRKITYRDPDGNEIPMQGKGTEVLRRQPDGNWRCVIDNPWGTENVYA